MDSTINTIKMITFNCQNIKTSMQHVRDLCGVADVVAVQETWLMPHDLGLVDTIDINFGSVSRSAMDTSKGVIRGRPYGGTALLWRRSKFPNVSIVDCGHDRIVAIHVKNGRHSFIIFSVYLPTDKTDNLSEFTDCLSRIHAVIEEYDVPFVYILGDFNAHPSAQFGKELLDFCAEQELSCVDIDVLGITSDTHTFESKAHGTCSWLDHCVTTTAARDTVKSVRVLYGVYTSDHVPLCIDCELEICRGSVVSGNYASHGDRDKIRWGYRDASQIDKYYEYCKREFLGINTYMTNELNVISKSNNYLDSSDDYFKIIDDMYCKIINILQLAAINSSIAQSSSKRKRVPLVGWNLHVQESHSTARVHYDVWLMAGKPATGDMYDKMVNSRKNFKNKVKWCIRNEETIKMDILAMHKEEKNFPKFWNATKKLQKKQSLPVAVDGLQQPKEIAELFVRQFKKEPLPTQQRTENKIHPVSEESVVQFTVDDVVKAIRGMKRGKSPGHDNLSIEHVLYAGEPLWSMLCVIYNLFVKYSYLPDPLMRTVVVPIVKNRTGDLSSSINYRPISLGTVVGKVFERLLRPELLRNLDIEDAQFGFRPGVSTDSAIVSLKYAMDYYVNRDTPVYACFLDLSSAFDLVNYEILWTKLRGFGVPESIVRLLAYWYGGQTNYVRWGDTTSNAYRLECGVRQGVEKFRRVYPKCF
ncbi:uncharacterized protein LOC126372623 [Pectinophora gossypiella]|uniref:uncharacterized protein LOC126367030 n=1 Tax=Pectinophora gossypiella TaxID=13191 RepID=UPI00214EF377|nr:uncharacterized protein LOC126367030 [Pectinophora gossypiella]XP_049874406.1 uncharacterized protein LOC126372623 [Pectinophora gossypiella]